MELLEDTAKGGGVMVARFFYWVCDDVCGWLYDSVNTIHDLTENLGNRFWKEP
jgi:cytochrome oxidase Cu insertion factor (SCO1/SenC/PrrC family)